MKTFVTNEQEQTRIPFLRGILIRSLQDAGLSFEEAYEFATTVRGELDEQPEITASELRSLVASRLRDQFDAEVHEQYRTPQVAPGRITVTNLDGKQSPFSRGRHHRYLLSSGVKAPAAEQVTDLVFDQLLGTGITHISTCELGYLTWLCLRQEVGKKASNRYLVWSEFQRSGRPLVLLVGGAVGTGKSTLATEIAHRLEIVRVQSTDMLREVMRMMLPARLLPVLHRSTFDAWKELPASEVGERDHELLVAEGYRTQADLLAVSCEAVLNRAACEGVPVIVEGVHAHPETAQGLELADDVIIVRVMLAVLRPEELKSRLRGRGKLEPNRSGDHYIENFESIWQLQAFLLSEADRCDVPIIPNEDREKAKGEIIRAISQELAGRFSGTPEEVFGQVANQGKSPDWRQFLTRLVA